MRAITYLDTHAAVAFLYKNRVVVKDQFELFPGPQWDSKDWSAIKKLTNAALSALTIASGEQPELAGVWVEKLSPGAVWPWQRQHEAGDTTYRFLLPLVTNPLCLTYSGNISVHLPVGQLTAIDMTQLCSAVNLGTEPRYHLVITIQKPEKEPVQ